MVLLPLWVAAAALLGVRAAAGRQVSAGGTPPPSPPSPPLAAGFPFPSPTPSPPPSPRPICPPPPPPAPAPQHPAAPSPSPPPVGSRCPPRGSRCLFPPLRSRRHTQPRPPPFSHPTAARGVSRGAELTFWHSVTIYTIRSIAQNPELPSGSVYVEVSAGSRNVSVGTAVCAVGGKTPSRGTKSRTVKNGAAREPVIFHAVLSPVAE